MKGRWRRGLSRRSTDESGVAHEHDNDDDFYDGEEGYYEDADVELDDAAPLPADGPEAEGPGSNNANATTTTKGGEDARTRVISTSDTTTTTMMTTDNNKTTTPTTTMEKTAMEKTTIVTPKGSTMGNSGQGKGKEPATAAVTVTIRETEEAA